MANTSVWSENQERVLDNKGWSSGLLLELHQFLSDMRVVVWTVISQAGIKVLLQKLERTNALQHRRRHELEELQTVGVNRNMMYIVYSMALSAAKSLYA